MNKSDLVESLTLEYEDELPPMDVRYAVDVILDSLTEALVLDRDIEIRGFGSFRNRRRKSQIGRNPQNGEEVHLGDRLIPSFKPGQDLRLRVRDFHH